MRGQKWRYAERKTKLGRYAVRKGGGGVTLNKAFYNYKIYTSVLGVLFRFETSDVLFFIYTCCYNKLKGSTIEKVLHSLKGCVPRPSESGHGVLTTKMSEQTYSR